MLFMPKPHAPSERNIMSTLTPKCVIVDFDNTMGVPRCDVDDGLALLYLLGNPDAVRVEAACTAYGNSSIDVVHENTTRLFAEWSFDVPILKGCANPLDETSEASRFLAQAAADNRGALSVLALGSLTNLKGAARIDPGFFGNLRETVLMGGVTESLAINGRIMNELNLSCDPQATLEVLSSPTPVSIATSQNCLPATFSRNDFLARFGGDSWIARTCDPWFSTMENAYGLDGFTCWDLVAAAYLAQPDLFDQQRQDVSLNAAFLSVGYLESARATAPRASIGVPRIIDPEAFKENAFLSWERALARLGL